MMSCPVCRGAGVIRLPPLEASPWNKRPTGGAVRAIEIAEQRCWACGGDAQLAVVDHDARPRASS